MVVLKDFLYHMKAKPKDGQAQKVNKGQFRSNQHQINQKDAGWEDKEDTPKRVERNSVGPFDYTEHFTRVRAMNTVNSKHKHTSTYHRRL